LKKLIDTVCPSGHVEKDVFVDSLIALPPCRRRTEWTERCGLPVERAWLSAPSITPNGTRVERNTDRPAVEAPVDAKAIAREMTTMVEERRATYGTERSAEQNVWREINHANGVTDHLGNPTPAPMPEPITFKNPAAANATA
jgi:hypothetical protein